MPEFTWETEDGKRVPKTCNITISYKVIHRQPPSWSTAFTEFFGVTNSAT